MKPNILRGLPSAVEHLVWSLWRLMTLRPIFFMTCLPVTVIVAPVSGQLDVSVVNLLLGAVMGSLVITTLFPVQSSSTL